MPGAIYLRGDGITLRTIEEEDLPFLRDTIDHPDVRRYLRTHTPINLDQERDFYERVICDDEAVNLLICADGESAGTIGLHPHNPVAGAGEIGIFLAPHAWGRGIGTEAARLITDHAFSELRYHRVCARFTAGNIGSRRIWEKLGYRHEGTFREADFHEGEHLDVHLYGILEDDWQGVARDDETV